MSGPHFTRLRVMDAQIAPRWSPFTSSAFNGGRRKCLGYPRWWSECRRRCEMDTASLCSAFRTYRDRSGEHQMAIPRPLDQSCSSGTPGARGECRCPKYLRTHTALPGIIRRAFANRDGETLSFVCCPNLFSGSRLRRGIKVDCRRQWENPSGRRLRIFGRQLLWDYSILPR